MDQQELKNILELHRKWVMGEEGGVRANLSSADLRSADLRSADLRSANLSSADLRSADLRSADLSSANLRYANLRSANLSSADLRSADLRSADLSYANLSHIKEDFFKRLLVAKNEAIGLYDAITRGKISGSSYQGECACFVGTIANLRNEHFKELKIDLRPDAESMTEKWFMGISTGDIPQNNSVSKITAEWVEEFAKKEGLTLPVYKLISSLEMPALFEKKA